LVSSTGIYLQFEGVILAVVSREFWEDLHELSEEDIIVNDQWKDVSGV
jgi:hypothetical protein